MGRIAPTDRRRIRVPPARIGDPRPPGGRGGAHRGYPEPQEQGTLMLRGPDAARWSCPALALAVQRDRRAASALRHAGDGRCARGPTLRRVESMLRAGRMVLRFTLPPWRRTSGSGGPRPSPPVSRLGPAARCTPPSMPAPGAPAGRIGASNSVLSAPGLARGASLRRAGLAARIPVRRYAARPHRLGIPVLRDAERVLRGP